jgi:hypothetical protein
VNVVPENPQPELDLLRDADWDIPLTEAFVTRVQRGVRRRRVERGLAAGGVLMALVMAVGIGVMINYENPVTTHVLPTPSAFSSTPLDGFRIGYLPEGVYAVVPDSGSTCVVSAEPYRCPAPQPGSPTATTSSRRFDRGVGMWMWIIVLRPQTTTATVDRAQITEWLVGWETAGTTPVDTFDTPVGPAQILATVGSEVTVHSIVIATGDGAVISVNGNAGLSIDDLRKVALSITPAP